MGTVVFLELSLCLGECSTILVLCVTDLPVDLFRKSTWNFCSEIALLLNAHFTLSQFYFQAINLWINVGCEFSIVGASVFSCLFTINARYCVA